MALQGSHQQSSELALEWNVCVISARRSCFIPKCYLKWEIMWLPWPNCRQPEKSQLASAACYTDIWEWFSVSKPQIEVRRKDTFFSSNWTSFLGWALFCQVVEMRKSQSSPGTPSDSPRHCIWVPWTHVEPRHGRGGCWYFTLTCLWWHLWRHPC